MPAPSIPNNFLVQTANGQNLITSDASAGATSYIVQRSLDSLTYTTIATVSVPSYLDTAVTLNTPYYYQMAASSTSGTSAYTNAQSVVPTISSEMSLAAIRLAAQQRADRVNSNFVSTQEWNSYINQAMLELYDILVTAYVDQFMAPAAQIVSDGSSFQYDLPNGSTTFQDQNNNDFVPRPFYKLLGVDLALSTANNGYVTVNRFNFIDRNRFVYPNSASTIYGVFNLQYRVMGSKIEFIPTPSGGQKIRLWYVPRIQLLLQDTDVTEVSVSGWIEYVIVRAAKYALDKEESDTSKFDTEILFLKQRIESASQNRDAGMPDTISDSRQGNWSNGWGGGPGGAVGGW